MIQAKPLALLATALALLACGGPSAAAQLRAQDARKPCYLAAEAEAQRRIDAECPGPFASCTAGGEIIDELRRAQEACKQ